MKCKNCGEILPFVVSKHACKTTKIETGTDSAGRAEFALLCAAAEQLEEAAALIEDWGSYASEYFQQKHDLRGDVDKFRTYAAYIRKHTGV